MAPVTGGVSDGKKDGLVFLFRLSECRFTPGEPIDRIVDMLEQVRAFFSGEMVGVHS
jgi:hypothetical protein